MNQVVTENPGVLSLVAAVLNLDYPEGITVKQIILKFLPLFLCVLFARFIAC